MRIKPATGGGGGDAAGPSGRPAESTEQLRPIVAGEIRDWEVLEALIEHVLYERVRQHS